MSLIASACIGTGCTRTQLPKLAWAWRRAKLRQRIRDFVPRTFRSDINMGKRPQLRVRFQGCNNQTNHPLRRRMVVETGPTCRTKHPQRTEGFNLEMREQLFPVYHLKLVERHEQQSSKIRAVSFAAEATMTIDHELQIIVDGILD